MTFEKSNIKFSNSTFTHIFGLSKGSVIWQSKGSTLQMINCSFIENASPFGGIASVAYSNAWLILKQCQIFNNFALESGVIAVDLEGSFEIQDSEIRDNYAYSNPISKILISSTENSISNSSLINNILLD